MRFLSHNDVFFQKFSFLIELDEAIVEQIVFGYRHLFRARSGVLVTRSSLVTLKGDTAEYCGKFQDPVGNFQIESGFDTENFYYEVFLFLQPL